MQPEPMIETRNPSQAARDYARIERALRFIRENHRDQPTLEEVADAAALSPFHFQRLFARWAGVTPKQFLGYLTLEHAKRTLDGAGSVLDAAYDAGLSGPSRLHDLFVGFEAVTPGEYKAMGAGLEIRWGAHDGPLGSFVVGATARGICALHFLADGGEKEALAEIARRYPGARLVEDPSGTAQIAAALFEPAVAGETGEARATPLRLWTKGTNFQIRVWRALLAIPEGALVTYGDLARAVGAPGAARAVGSAVGANPVAVLIPCHRVIRAAEPFETSYRWGTERKLALIGLEQARAAAAEPERRIA